MKNIIVDKKYFDSIELETIDNILNSISYRKELMIPNSKLSESLKFYLVLTYGKEKIPFLSPEIIYTSRYYWLKLFYHFYVLEFGQDAGIEQQIGKLVEEMSNELKNYDWNILEKISDDIDKELNE